MIVAIDLGTTHSLISIWKDRQSKLIRNENESYLTPSVISVGEDNQIIIGDEAVKRLMTHPSKTIAHFKRYMGTDKIFKLGKLEFRAEELSALILKRLKEDCEAATGEKITEAIISVPAYFNDTQRKATKLSGKIAGLNVERLINEPTAAGLAYGLHNQHADTNYCIIDLGGGTFDVSILTLFEQIIEVNASTGDNFLGGEDFTQAISQAFLHYADEQGINCKELLAVELEELRLKAELAKRELSNGSMTTISITLQNKQLDWQLTEKEFETMTAHLLDKVKLPIERALRDAKLSPNDIKEIVLVGGATYMPIFRKLITRIFGRFPNCQLNPEEIVVRGVAVQTGLKARDSALNEVVVTDVCPYSLGVAAVTETMANYQELIFVPIIERNTIIPTSKTKRFATGGADQTELNVRIFQGESYFPDENISLGILNVTFPPSKHQTTQPVDIRFTYDINGILEAEVHLPESDKKASLVIQGNPGSLSEDDLQEAIARMQLLKIHPRKKSANAKLIEKLNVLFQQTLSDDRNQISQMIAAFNSALDMQDESQIEAVKSKILQELRELNVSVDEVE